MTLPKVNMLEVLDESTGEIYYVTLESNFVYRYSVGQEYVGEVEK